GVRIRHEHSDSRVTWAVNHGHGLRLQKIRLGTRRNRLFWKRKSPGRPWRFPGEPARSYLISTLAPASSSFFLASSAAALSTPSLTGFGAPSTRSLASLRPR